MYFCLVQIQNLSRIMDYRSSWVLDDPIIWDNFVKILKIFTMNAESLH